MAKRPSHEVAKIVQELETIIAEKIVRVWLKTKIPEFGNKTPIQVISDQGSEVLMEEIKKLEEKL